MDSKDPSDKEMISPACDGVLYLPPVECAYELPSTSGTVNKPINKYCSKLTATCCPRADRH